MKSRKLKRRVVKPSFKSLSCWWRKCRVLQGFVFYKVEFWYIWFPFWKNYASTGKVNPNTGTSYYVDNLHFSEEDAIEYTQKQILILNNNLSSKLMIKLTNFYENSKLKKILFNRYL
jgi:hypothetical protein